MMKSMINLTLIAAGLATTTPLWASDKSRLADLIVAHEKIKKTIVDTQETFRAARERFEACEAEIKNPPLASVLKHIPPNLGPAKMAKILLLEEWHSTLLALKALYPDANRYALVVDFWLPETTDEAQIERDANQVLAGTLDLAPLFPTRPTQMTESALAAKINALQRVTRQWQRLESGERSDTLETMGGVNFQARTELQYDESLADFRRESEAIPKEDLTASRALSARYFQNFNSYALNMRRYLVLRDEMTNVDEHLKKLAADEASLGKTRAMVQKMVDDAAKPNRVSSKGDR